MCAIDNGLHVTDLYLWYTEICQQDTTVSKTRLSSPFLVKAGAIVKCH